MREPISKEVEVEVPTLSEAQSFNRGARVGHTITGSPQEESYHLTIILVVLNKEDVPMRGIDWGLLIVTGSGWQRGF